jgi:hypothetical protein
VVAADVGGVSAAASPSGLIRQSGTTLSSEDIARVSRRQAFEGEKLEHPTAEQTAAVIVQIKNVRRVDVRQELQTAISQWNFQTVPIAEEMALDDFEELELAKQLFPNYSPGKPEVVRLGHPLVESRKGISRAAADLLGKWARTFPANQDPAGTPLYSGFNADALLLLSRQIVAPPVSTVAKKFQGFRREEGRFIFRTIDATWQSVEANSHELAFLLSTSTHGDLTTIEVGKLRTRGDLGRYLTDADEVFGQIL